MNSIKMAKEVVVWETLSDLSLISTHHLPRSQSYLLWETFPRWNWCSPSSVSSELFVLSRELCLSLGCYVSHFIFHFFLCVCSCTHACSTWMCVLLLLLLLLEIFPSLSESFPCGYSHPLIRSLLHVNSQGIRGLHPSGAT